MRAHGRQALVSIQAPMRRARILPPSLRYRVLRRVVRRIAVLLDVGRDIAHRLCFFNSAATWAGRAMG